MFSSNQEMNSDNLREALQCTVQRIQGFFIVIHHKENTTVQLLSSLTNNQK